MVPKLSDHRTRPELGSGGQGRVSRRKEECLFERLPSRAFTPDWSRDTLPWKAPWQPYTAWFGGIGSVIITLVCGFPVFLKGNWSTADFIASHIGIPIFIIPIIGWKIAYGTKLHRAKDIDVWSGRLSVEEPTGQLSEKNAA